MNINYDSKIFNIKINIGYDLELIIVENGKPNKICLFINGLNGDKNAIKYFRKINDSFLVSFNHRQWDDNTQPGSKNPNVYIDDIYKIIVKLKEIYPNNKIFLLGESWGSALSIIFQKNYSDMIDGVFTWNMPFGIKKLEDSESKNSIVNSFRMILTLLFNKNYYSPTMFPHELTNNVILKRAIKIRNKDKKASNRVIIAAWKSFKKSWKILLKNVSKKSNLNFVYVQSMGDALISEKKVNKLKHKLYENQKKIYIFDKGTHILSFDIEECKKLFDLINLKLSEW